jgi:hypothetical protein|tara:strand:- start:986 stop:1276 length:291 start_codon:yes stop_codon:yes gene_type:complete
MSIFRFFFDDGNIRSDVIDPTIIIILNTFENSSFTKLLLNPDEADCETTNSPVKKRIRIEKRFMEFVFLTNSPAISNIVVEINKAISGITKENIFI